MGCACTYRIRSLSSKGRLRNRMLFASVNTVAFTPIPSASATTAVAVNPGFLSSVRSPKRRSSSRCMSDVRGRGRRSSLLEIQRVEEKLIRAVRLAAPLRTEAEQQHATLTVSHVDRGGLAFDALRPGQVAAHERIAIARIARQHRTLEVALGIERRSALEHHDGIGG